MIRGVLVTIVLTTSLRDAGAVAVTSGLIGYWPADGNGSDQSGFGRDLTLNGGLAFSSGLAGQAFSFANNNAQFATRTQDDAEFNFGIGDFTLQVWVNFNAFGSAEHTLMEKFTGVSGPGWTLTQLPGPSIMFAGNGAILDTRGAPSLVGFTAQRWHDILVRRSNNVFNLFFDGVLVRTNSAANLIADSTQPLRIGNRQGPQSFPMNGQIDEAAIWNRALTDAEIASVYSEYGSPHPPSEPAIWSIASGGNGHAYEFVPAGGIDWPAAKDAAAAKSYQGVAGHLATATSASENEFLHQLMIDSANSQGISPFIEAWLGGFQTNPAGPANQSWTWVTGEPWSYANWDSDEPNDSSGDERYLGIWGPFGDGPAGQWNDQGGPNDGSAAGNIQGYLVEYPVPEPAGLLLGLILAALAPLRRFAGRAL
jgi:hypothetical protein